MEPRYVSNENMGSRRTFKTRRNCGVDSNVAGFAKSCTNNGLTERVNERRAGEQRVERRRIRDGNGLKGISEPLGLPASRVQEISEGTSGPRNRGNWNRFTWLSPFLFPSHRHPSRDRDPRQGWFLRKKSRNNCFLSFSFFLFL